jgi:enamine deaminase RidA (YjgF/YER057c/UK114 family)
MPRGTYSQGIVSEQFLFISGQGPDGAGVDRSNGTFTEQARRAFTNVAAIAEAAGASLDDTVRIGV